MKKNGFTMIELIFVIVILGVLAAVAIPKLAATRDDAQMTVALKNVPAAIMDIGTTYTGTGVLALASTDVTLVGKCFTYALSDVSGDGNNDSIVVSGSAGDDTYCPAAVARATSLNLIGAHTFGGSSVAY